MSVVGQESPSARDQLREQIRQQVREQVRHAQEQAAMACEEAHRAREDARMAGRNVAPHRSITVQPFHPPPTIPSEAVEIAISFFVMTAIVILGLPLLRAFGRRLGAPVSAPVADPDVDARLTRIEQAVQAVAIEVERIGEGQRFTAQLFAKAGGDPALASPKPSGS